MKTYFVNKNSMHLANNQEDLSDQFFGSESPETDQTDSQRMDAINFWLGEGWLQPGDTIVWDGVSYCVGEQSPATESYTVLEVAGIFRVTPKTVYNWAEAGKFPVIRTSKKSGSKLLFPKAAIHAALRPAQEDLCTDINKRLADGLVGLFAKLSNGDVQMVRGVKTARNTSIEILVNKYGYFTLGGKSLADGEMADLHIVGFYTNPQMAK
jgi:excisionase family DNA binding protein